MKKLTFIVCAALLVSSCATKNSEDKIKKIVKLYLDSTLKDPKSYEPISLVIDTLTETEGMDKGRLYGYMVTHSFRAKNGFGALDINDMEFKIDSAITGVQFSQPAKHRFKNSKRQ